MRKPDTLRLHPTEKLEAFRLELRAFVTNLLIWIVDTLDTAPKRSLLRTLMQTPPLAAALREARRTIARDLRASVHDLKIYLLALAFIRTAPMIQKRTATHTKRPASVPPGFRRARQRTAFHRHRIGDTLKDFHRGESLRLTMPRRRRAFWPLPLLTFC